MVRGSKVVRQHGSQVVAVVSRAPPRHTNMELLYGNYGYYVYTYYGTPGDHRAEQEDGGKVGHDASENCERYERHLH